MNEHTRDVVLFEIKESFNLNVFAADGDFVAFPNRKSYFFDNKLEFSVTKLAES